MSSTFHARPTSSAAWPASPEADALLHTIVIASDGTPTSMPALRVGALLAHRHGARVRVVTVLDPLLLAPPLPGADGYVPDPDLVQRAGTERLQLVREQLDDARGEHRWPIDLRIGSPASHVVHEAAACHADLLCTGLRKHSLMDRLFGGETSLQIMRRSTIPVLAASPALTGLPRRIVVGVDFSRSSLRAAHLAAQLLADGGVLTLVHVALAFGESTEESEGFELVMSEGVAGALGRLSAGLRLPHGATVETIPLTGTPAAELLAFAHRRGADLLAVGSHKHRMIDRIVLGSVTNDVVRDARCSVLTAPPAPAPREEAP